MSESHKPTPEPLTGFRQVLQNQGFLMLWGSQISAQIADKVFFTLLIATLSSYPTLHSSNSMRSAVMVAYTLPAILFGSAAGIYVDRWPKQRVLLACNMLRALLVLALTVFPAHFLLLLLLTFLVSTLTQFFAPAEQSAIPLLIRPDGLLAANALFTNSLVGSLLVGYAIGEPLLSWAKSWSPTFGREVLVAGMYLLAGLLVLRPIPEVIALKAGQKTHFWADLWEGIDYLRLNRQVSSALMQLTVLFSTLAALFVLNIGLAQEMGLKSEQFGFLIAPVGLGLAVGSVWLGQVGHRFSHLPLPLFGFLGIAVSLAVFTIAPNLWAGLSLSVLLGFSASLVAVPMQTLIQEQTPEHMRGKVFGIENNATNIALSLPLVLAGILADALGLRVVLLGLSVLVALSGTWAWSITSKGFLGFWTWWR
ncbi:MFS transporter [Leptolyngbya sp. FACHB-261]|uniref:MFS transporter n=1 Tax=Leptolyngbya sp. FACHB-261 TaxID=2692806 RepID=UPI0016870B1E|nr:MFS transporter [Leptolyngbya sp. FACHB-261]MBD2100120.1 MFS transporter [Leptolyngbya sp. FACHB-261]